GFVESWFKQFDWLENINKGNFLEMLEWYRKKDPKLLGCIACLDPRDYFANFALENDCERTCLIDQLLLFIDETHMFHTTVAMSKEEEILEQLSHVVLNANVCISVCIRVDYSVSQLDQYMHLFLVFFCCNRIYLAQNFVPVKNCRSILLASRVKLLASTMRFFYKPKGPMNRSPFRKLLLKLVGNGGFTVSVAAIIQGKIQNSFAREAESEKIFFLRAKWAIWFGSKPFISKIVDEMDIDNSHIIVGLWLQSIVITILHLKKLDENKFYIKIIEKYVLVCAREET
ncbi:hypothetical protein ACJX0J_041055, partial [Zea mays]